MKNKVGFVGEQIGTYTAIKYNEDTKRWLYECECGHQLSRQHAVMIKTYKCMACKEIQIYTPPQDEFLGKTFGSNLIINKIDNTTYTMECVKCKRQRITHRSNLINGLSNGCICNIKQKTYKSEEEMRQWIRDNTAINPSTKCWEFNGKIQKTGYVYKSYRGVNMGIHKLSHILFNGPIPEGMEVMHSCDVRHCCNPKHLSYGTKQENFADMYAKGRGNKSHGSSHIHAKLNENKVRKIRIMLKNGITQVDIAKKYKVSVHVIHSIMIGSTWKHVK